MMEKLNIDEVMALQILGMATPEILKTDLVAFDKLYASTPVDTQFMDYSDDRYIVIDENYKCWGYDMIVQCTDLFPPSMPVPEDMRKRLIEKYEWATEGEGN